MSAPSVGPERILVVDDEPAMRRMIARLVTEAGHAVEVAESAAEARERLEAGPFALAICDLNMPGEDGDSLARWIRATRPDVAVLIATGTDDRQIAEAAIAAGAFGYLLKPFKRNEVAINIDNALHRRRLEIENREHRELLEQRVEERTFELRRSREETIRRLSLAIEFRSQETGAHVERVGVTAAILAGRLGLDSGLCDRLRVAAVLHDVGKIGIADAILLKPGPLTDEERAQMREHTRIGYALLAGSGSALLELAAVIAWSHHEYWVGSGYPRGLAGEAIPIEGRITSVADVFDALTHDRIYRPKPFTRDEAVQILRDGAGTQFDPAVVEAFLAT